MGIGKYYLSIFPFVKPDKFFERTFLIRENKKTKRFFKAFAHIVAG